MERWNLPENDFERQERVSEIADEIIRGYDEVFYDYMNKILDLVREEAKNSHGTTQDSLAQQALQALGIPKIP